MGFDTSELRALSADLGKGAARTEPLAEKVVAKTALGIEADGKINAPVDTGHLMNSISSDVHGLSAEIGPTANYGHFVEGGTSRMAPQPYMGPAADKWFPVLEQAITKIGEVL
jgi:HK97 gp10 family phage protein